MSKRLDDELAAAIEASSAKGPRPEETSSPAIAKPAIEAPPPQKRNIGLLLTLLVMVGALLALVFVGFKGSAVYAVDVDTIADNPDLIGKRVRVEGELVPGTLMKREQPCEYRFTIHGKTKGKDLPVRYEQCVIPDSFRDVPQGGVEVTVEGALTSSKDFEATLVMAKCASKYDPSTHTMAGPQEKAENTFR